MDLRKLRYFVTVVQEKNYSKAAKILHISQPSLSNAIMKLEHEAGMKLLERNTRGLSLTEAGKIYYLKSKDLLRKFDNTLKELDEMKEIGNGKISVGLIESSKFWFPKVVKDFKLIYPNVHFQLKEILGYDQVINSLIHHDVHFAVTNQLIYDEEIILAPLYKEKLILLTPVEDTLNEKDSITIRDLAEKDFIICTTGFQTRENVLQAFKNENINPNIMYEIERFETACSLVEQGLGVTILPESYIKYNHNPNIATHTIHSDFLVRSVYLAYLKERYLSPAIFQLIAIMEEFFRNE
ncbi:LysR family transcriptional regulator [Heyndrickxia sp. NPDC080065]|uniref:LysR family transcriptional regulator n=1 Tax=Heyndrickxia sp. NPDC080065 TaxID=3390568 RepID=UPI003D01379C